MSTGVGPHHSNLSCGNNAPLGHSSLPSVVRWTFDWSDGMRIAILGWEEGLAGQVSTWVENAIGAQLVCFVHPFESLPTIDPLVAFDRPAKRFSIPIGGLYRGLPIVVELD
jgi:hypothetical protein